MTGRGGGGGRFPDLYEDNGVDLCYQIHPTEDTFDGDTFEMFMVAIGGHARCHINFHSSHFIRQ